MYPLLYIENICMGKSVYSLQSSTEGNHVLKAKAREKIPPYVRALAGDTVLILLKQNGENKSCCNEVCSITTFKKYFEQFTR